MPAKKKATKVEEVEVEATEATEEAPKKKGRRTKYDYPAEINTPELKRKFRRAARKAAKKAAAEAAAAEAAPNDEAEG